MSIILENYWCLGIRVEPKNRKSWGKSQSFSVTKCFNLLIAIVHQLCNMEIVYSKTNDWFQNNAKITYSRDFAVFSLQSPTGIIFYLIKRYNEKSNWAKLICSLLFYTQPSHIPKHVIMINFHWIIESVKEKSIANKFMTHLELSI